MSSALEQIALRGRMGLDPTRRLPAKAKAELKAKIDVEQRRRAKTVARIDRELVFEAIERSRCSGRTLHGDPCVNLTDDASGYCGIHRRGWARR